MKKIFDLLSDPSFWFAAIFISFIVNIIAGFIKDWIQNIWVRYSKRRKDKFNRESLLFQEKVKYLKDNPDVLRVYQLNFIYLSVLQAGYSIFLSICMFLAVHNLLNNSYSAATFFMFFTFVFYFFLFEPITKKMTYFSRLINSAVEIEGVDFSLF